MTAGMSPEIKVILMISMTIILAAVIASFVIGLELGRGFTYITVRDKCTGIDGLYRLVYNNNETALVDAPNWNKAIVGKEYYAGINFGYHDLAGKNAFTIFVLLTEEEYRSTCEGKGYRC
jgi:hypothetical protein